jgi:hypothetical protein
MGLALMAFVWTGVASFDARAASCLSISGSTSPVPLGSTLQFSAQCCSAAPALSSGAAWLLGGAILVLGLLALGRFGRRAAQQNLLLLVLLALFEVLALAERPVSAQSCGGPFQWTAQSGSQQFTGTGPTFSFTPTATGTFVVTLQDASETATSTVSVFSCGPSSNAGEISCFWFGQGTATGQGCSSFKTFCGYCGTESGSNNGGPCPTGITDLVSNTGTPHFVAFPSGTFGQGVYCGMCVEVTYQGKSVVATVVDECATCASSAHLDLSLSAAVALGLGQNGTTGDATNGVTWKAVDCPVTGNILAVFNNGFAGQIYFQNVVFPVTSVTAGGHVGTQSLGFWNFGTSVAGQTVTLTDSQGHTVTGTIPASSGGSIGVQFPSVAACMP